jgi:ornithine decarboxylase
MGSLGISFHVGSQQKHPSAWKRALLDTYKVISSLKNYNVEVKIINIGGGFPASGYLGVDDTPEIYDFKYYGSEILSYINQIFGDDHNYYFMCEPGRFLLAEAGCIKTQIILATDKNIGDELQRWLYLDIGKFNGLYEGTDIKHPISYEGSSQNKLVATTLAGPSCDSDDMLSFGGGLHLLPSDIKADEYLIFGLTGAYSSSYVTSGFNGIPPLNEYYI